MSLPSIASGFAFFVSLFKTQLALSLFVLKSQASVWTSSKILKNASPFAKKTDNIFRKLGINFIPVVPPFLINSPRAVVISCSILFFVSSSVFFILFIIGIKVFVVSPSSKIKNISLVSDVLFPPLLTITFCFNIILSKSDFNISSCFEVGPTLLPLVALQVFPISMSSGLKK